MFRKMKLSSKLYLGFATVVVIAAILGFVGWNGTAKMRHQMASERSGFLQNGSNMISKRSPIDLWYSRGLLLVNT